MMKNFKVSIHSLTNGKYQTDYLCPVSKRRKRKTFDTKKEAKFYRDKLEVKYHKKDMSYFLEMNIGKLIEHHLKKCPNSKMTSRTVPFKEFYNSFARHRLHEINTQRLREWFDELKTKYNYSEKTLLHAKIALMNFFRFLVEEEITDSNILAPIKFKKRVAPTRPRIYFSKEEVNQIVENAKKWDKEGAYTKYFAPFVYVLAHTGARREEVSNLKWEDVDFELNSLTFRDTKVNDDRSIVMAKGLRRLIENLPKTCEYVFTNQYGDKGLNPNMASRHLIEFREEYPMPNYKKDWGFHALRHSFAYNYLKEGGSMYQLQAILGHYNITSTVNTYGRIKASDDEMPSPYNF